MNQSAVGAQLPKSFDKSISAFALDLPELSRVYIYSICIEQWTFARSPTSLYVKAALAYTRYKLCKVLLSNPVTDYALGRARAFSVNLLHPAFL